MFDYDDEEDAFAIGALEDAATRSGRVPQRQVLDADEAAFLRSQGRDAGVIQDALDLRQLTYFDGDPFAVRSAADPGFSNAIRRFQSDASPDAGPVDGKTGPKTRAALAAAFRVVPTDPVEPPAPAHVYVTPAAPAPTPPSPVAPAPVPGPSPVAPAPVAPVIPAVAPILGETKAPGMALGYKLGMGLLAAAAVFAGWPVRRRRGRK